MGSLPLILVCVLMELRFIVFLHITNRPVHIENTRLYIANKEEIEREENRVNTQH